MNRRLLTHLAALLLLASPAGAAVRHVGPGQTYTTCGGAGGAAAASGAGDSIIIHGTGPYNQDWAIWSAANLVIVGENFRQGFTVPADTTAYKALLATRPVFDGQSVQPDPIGTGEDDEGIWVFQSGATNHKVIGVRFKNAVSVSGQNGAGIRLKATNTGWGSYAYNQFDTCQDGFLGAADSLYFGFNEFVRCGHSTGQAHSLYINTPGSPRALRFEHNWSHLGVGGHLLKSRAIYNYVNGNVFDEAGGTNDYNSDFPDAGRVFYIGNLVIQGPETTNNSGIVSFGAESGLNSILEFYAFNNTMVNNRANGTGTYFFFRSGTTGNVQNNILYGPGTDVSGGTMTKDHNYQESTQLDGPKFKSAPTGDFHLTAQSPAFIVNSGIDPGTIAGFVATQTKQYVFDLLSENRTTSGAGIDLGAFEFTTIAGTPCVPF